MKKIITYLILFIVLIDLNIPASFFFISNCVDNKDLMWRNKLLIIFKYLDENRFNVFLKKYSLNEKIILKNIKFFLSTSLNYLDMSQKEFSYMIKKVQESIIFLRTKKNNIKF